MTAHLSNTYSKHLGELNRSALDRQAMDSLKGQGIQQVLPNFVRVTAELKLRALEEYNQKRLLSLDLWSAITVLLLEPKAEEHLLDLCCAPGAKLVLASKLGFASVTGVDISPHRLSIARSFAKQYKLPAVRLYCQDGRAFDQQPCIRDDDKHCTSKELPVKKPFYSSSIFRKHPCRIVHDLYDKVLVDVQCTHDGSIKHVVKNIRNGWSKFDWKQLDNLDDLYALQYSLLCNGWKMLKPGGMLIYSTCSLSRAQGEHIVEKLLSQHPDAAIFDFKVDLLTGCSYTSSGGILRIDPDKDNIDKRNGGFFIARLRKEW